MCLCVYSQGLGKVSEIKLSSKESSAWFSDCNSYTVYRKDRQGGGGEGGVVILLGNDAIF